MISAVKSKAEENVVPDEHPLSTGGKKKIKLHF